MRKRVFEDFLLNKLYGYYLVLYGNDRLFSAKLVFLFGQTAIFFLTLTRLISPRICPSSHSHKIKIAPAVIKTFDMGKIQERAYFLWAEKGFPENTDLENWLEAEKLLYC